MLRGWFAGGEPFDDAEFEALVAFDGEPVFPYVVEWATPEVLPSDRNGDQLQQTLRHAPQPGRADDVISQYQQTTGSQYPPHLPDRGPLVGDGAQREGAHHGVERRVREIQLLRVADPQLDRAPTLRHAAAGVPQHFRAQVDAGQPHLVGIESQIRPSSDSDLEHIARGLPADPLAGVTKEVPVGNGHVLVVPARLLVPVAAQLLQVLAWRGHALTVGRREAVAPSRGCLDGYAGAVEQRISLVTLGVRDLTRARRFYESLGWQGQEIEETVFFQAGCVVVVLWGRDRLAADAGLENSGADGFGGMTLAHNVRSRTEVDTVMGEAANAGAEIMCPAQETFYGGYAGCFTDPDGHVWEIAYNPGFPLGPDGAITLPDFSG